MTGTSIGKVRNLVERHVGSKVVVRCNLGRHKINVMEGVIIQTFPSIFLVEVEHKQDNSLQTVSYSYTDVLTKDVQITLC